MQRPTSVLEIDASPPPPSNSPAFKTPMRAARGFVMLTPPSSQGRVFMREGQPYRFVGMNMWAGMHLVHEVVLAEQTAKQAPAVAQSLCVSSIGCSPWACAGIRKCRELSERANCTYCAPSAPASFHLLSPAHLESSSACSQFTSPCFRRRSRRFAVAPATDASAKDAHVQVSMSGAYAGSHAPLRVFDPHISGSASAHGA
eukprot:5102078-Pleurochrysis_carterae.AAC.5